MNIQEKLDKIKPYYWPILSLVLIVIFVEVWKLSEVLSLKKPIEIKYSNSTSTALAMVGLDNSSQEVIGSKNSKKYYFPWCGTVKKIKPENQVHFDSFESARQAGFVPGGNCKGLQ